MGPIHSVLRVAAVPHCRTLELIHQRVKPDKDSQLR